MPTSPDCLCAAFDALCRRDPDAVLVRSASDAWSVGRVDRLARCLEPGLRHVAADDRPVVAVQAPNGPGFLAALLATLRAGRVALLIDAQAPAAEVERISARLGVAGRLRCRAAWPDTPEAFVFDAARGARALPATPSPTRVIKLTSGSTGEPRGVATSAEALLADDAALTRTMGIRPDDRLLAAIPFSHSYGLSSLVLPALVRGLPLILTDRAPCFDSLDVAEAGAATVFPTVPAWLAAHVAPAEPRPLPRTLRLVISAGAPLPAAVALRFRETHGLPVHVFYGASECGGIAYDREGRAAERGTVGTPVEGVLLEPLPEGGASASGCRVVVRSAAVAERYLPDADPALEDGRFRSTDEAVAAGGEIRLVGRVSDVINVRGNKVNPREVEAVIAAHPAVLDVRVAGVTRPSSGDEIVRAAIACRPGTLTEEQVRCWCRERLSESKVPRSIWLVERLPTNAAGKVARAWLTGPASGRGPGIDDEDLARDR